MNITFEPPTSADAETLRDIQVASFHSDAQIYPGVGLTGPRTKGPWRRGQPGASWALGWIIPILPNIGDSWTAW